MNCIVKINGREAVPVRAIPFVTGWTSFSPDAIAEGLAHQLKSGKLEDLTAYHIARDGTVAAMLPKEWDGIVKELEALSDTLDAEETVKHASYPLWREQSVPVLPSHTFVWRDEFETSANAWWSKLYLVGERPGDKAFNFTPRIPPKLVDTVFEGMPQAESQQAAQPATTLPGGPDGPEQSCLALAQPKVENQVSNETAQIPAKPAKVCKTGWPAWKSPLFDRWYEISEYYGRPPTAREALEWAAKLGPAVFIRDQTIDVNFKYIDYEGEQQERSVKTVQNAVSKWKKEGLIPK